MKEKQIKEKNLDTILVLNFGGQYTHLIGRRIREQKVYSEVIPCHIGLEKYNELNREYNIKGILLSGGPSSVYEEDAPDFDDEILNLDIPILGICYGHQLLAKKVGGDVKHGAKGEYGIIYPELLNKDGLLNGIEESKIKGWTSHQDIVKELPSSFEISASTKNCPIAAFENKNEKFYGVQWHPEVAHTDYGNPVFKNFLFEICGCEPSGEMRDFAKKAIEIIKEKVGDNRSIIGVSGGVDSTTAAVLASKAIGDNLTAVFVDHGLLRKDEVNQVENILSDYKLDLRVLDESERFFDRLDGVTNPERKRKIIGEEFIRVFERVAREVGAEYFIQGTIYSDWIESGSEDHSATIKSHHNVGGLPSKIDFEGIVEPLRDLYKDEARQVSESLGLPDNIVWRQPFPGPGLAVRVIDEVNPENIEILKEADKILREEIDSRSDINPWQYFSVLLSTRSTGVKGDARDYGYVIALRAVESNEAMTANFAKLPYDLLEKISNRTVNEIPEVTRVVYDITHKPPATIEWE